MTKKDVVLGDSYTRTHDSDTFSPILKSDWDGKKAGKRKPISVVVFQAVRAGNLFFLDAECTPGRRRLFAERVCVESILNSIQLSGISQFYMWEKQVK